MIESAGISLFILVLILIFFVVGMILIMFFLSSFVRKEYGIESQAINELHFCKNCFFFTDNTFYGECNYVSNVYYKRKQDYYSSKIILCYREDPRKINQYNDCTWYAHKDLDERIKDQKKRYYTN